LNKRWRSWPVYSLRNFAVLRVEEAADWGDNRGIALEV